MKLKHEYILLNYCISSQNFTCNKGLRRRKLFIMILETSTREPSSVHPWLPEMNLVSERHRRVSRDKEVKRWMRCASRLKINCDDATVSASANIAG